MKLAATDKEQEKPSPLPSRSELLSQIDNHIASAQSQAHRLALLIFNLQGFREVNINFGPSQGDILLQRVAQRIEGVLRADDQLFHIGSDEFAVLLKNLKAPQVAQLAIEKVMHAIETPSHALGSLPPASARAGGAIFPDHAENRDDLLRAADSALYSARKARQRYKIYDTSIREHHQQRTQLCKDLSLGLKNNQLLFYYQPQLDLQRGGLKGCEALIRWPHETQGWINPESFIVLAEESGLIEDLTYWSFNIILREWKLLSARRPGTSIAINLSAALLNTPEIVEMVNRAINIWGIEPASLTLEVTESAMMADPQAALQTLNALGELGIQLSIDDFGTGYSSLTYLKRLPVKELKIDKSFVMNMMEDDRDRKIVQSVIDLAHNLNMHVVAEGIENLATLDMLREMGCDIGQGYYINRPLPLEEMTTFIDQNP